MRIHIERQNKNVNIKFSGTVKSLLKKLKINSEEVIVTRGNELLSDDTKLRDIDKVKILSVISGG